MTWPNWTREIIFCAFIVTGWKSQAIRSNPWGSKDRKGKAGIEEGWEWHLPLYKPRCWCLLCSLHRKIRWNLARLTVLLLNNSAPRQCYLESQIWERFYKMDCPCVTYGSVIGCRSLSWGRCLGLNPKFQNLLREQSDVGMELVLSSMSSSFWSTRSSTTWSSYRLLYLKQTEVVVKSHQNSLAEFWLLWVLMIIWLTN